MLSSWEKWSGLNRVLGNIYIKNVERKICKENRILRGNLRKRGVLRDKWRGKYVLFFSEFDFEKEEKNVL